MRGKCEFQIEAIWNRRQSGFGGRIEADVILPVRLNGEIKSYLDLNVHDWLTFKSGGDIISSACSRLKWRAAYRVFGNLSSREL